MALGSVTLLSDLDFNVTCKGRERTGEDALAALAEALDEIDIARKFTATVQIATNRQGSTLFDTNFYTNTFAYGPELGHVCSKQPTQGVAMALYAAAKGFASAAQYASSRCPTSHDANPFRVSFDETGPDLTTLRKDGFAVNARSSRGSLGAAIKAMEKKA